MSELLLQADRLLAVGLFDQAESTYRRALEADPRSAAAVVGLGKCAIERDDAAAGHAWMLRALEIDPADDAALRLEERLAQVLSARGESVPRPRITYEDRRSMATGGHADAGAPAVQPQTASASNETGWGSGTGSAAGAGSKGPGASTNGHRTGAARRRLVQRILGR